jgi:hypothetical protein
MNLIATMKNAQTQVISENPVQITIHRTTKEEKDGGFKEHKSNVGPFTVRVYQQKAVNSQESSALVGTKYVSKSWGLLTDYQADVQATPDIRDEFDVEDIGHFRILAVYPQKIQGEIWGYQADLEKVS